MAPNQSFPDGESPQEFYNRTLFSFKESAKRFSTLNENVLICTHGANMMALFSSLQNQNWKYAERKTFQPCVLLKIDLEKQTIEIILPLESSSFSSTGFLKRIGLKFQNFFIKNNTK